jgi:ubiquitin-like 1-activating enzyme E1 B
MARVEIASRKIFVSGNLPEPPPRDLRVMGAPETAAGARASAPAAAPADGAPAAAAAAAAAAAWPWCLFAPGAAARVAAARVLVVGAGGIGCELLKTAVLAGFRDLEVLDLDTIEVSNLNRQFLFRAAHVGRPKAEVAAAAAARLRPGSGAAGDAAASITPHHANVKEPRFGAAFLRRFGLVLNGLDNLDARRHVNRLALAAGVPLVESGTAGWLGQVTVHPGGAAACFECAPKPVVKSYPVCTIRNTPDKPIHCLVWAKDLLFARLFGPAGATDLDEGAEGGGEGGAEGGGEGGAGGGGAAEAAAGALARREGEGARAFAARVFRRVFGADVAALAAVGDMWKERPPPAPLDLAALLAAEGAPALAAAAAAPPGASAAAALGLADEHAPWPPAAAAAVFLEAARRLLEERAAEVGALAFDKDDALACEFVAAAAALRGASFGIHALPLFEARGVAGAIVHAVATTNAVVAGLVVQEALKLLLGGGAPAAAPTGRRLLTPAALDPRSPACAVCGAARLALRIDTERATLGELLDAVLKGRLALVAPCLVAGGFAYEEGEGLDADEEAAYAALRPRTLAALPGGGLRDGAVLEVTDQEQDLRVQVVVTHAAEWDEDARPERFVLEGEAPAAAAPTAGEDAGPAAAAAPEEEDADDIVIEAEDGKATAAGKGKGKAKRARGGEGGARGAKRARPAAAAADAIEILD